MSAMPFVLQPRLEDFKRRRGRESINDIVSVRSLQFVAYRKSRVPEELWPVLSVFEFQVCCQPLQLLSP